jgi:hypothetical protein
MFVPRNEYKVMTAASKLRAKVAAHCAGTHHDDTHAMYLISTRLYSRRAFMSI